MDNSTAKLQPGGHRSTRTQQIVAFDPCGTVPYYLGTESASFGNAFLSTLS